uniref:Uncharacterized protein n=2 Tax=Meloidogyne incognita TaxID=6306 RepID=A0A914M6V6_MELIC
MRTSIFSICSLAVCLRRILLLSVASSLVYLALWNFSFPSEWKNPLISPSTQYRSLLSNDRWKDNERRKNDEMKRPQNLINSKDERPKNDLTEAINYNKLDNLLLETAASKSILMGAIKLEEVTEAQQQKEKELPPPLSKSEYCPELEKNIYLKGHIGQATLLIEELEEGEVANANTDLDPGGSWKPLNCTARHKVSS